MGKKKFKRLAWEDLPVDTLVEVEIAPGIWAKRYLQYAGHGVVRCFPEGRTSKTLDANEEAVAYPNARFIESVFTWVASESIVKEIRDQGFKLMSNYHILEDGQSTPFWVLNGIKRRKSFSPYFKNPDSD